MKSLNYKETVEYILSTPKFTKKNPVDNIKALMEALNNPQRSLKVIHVAGTNGKGSVCSFLASMLDEGKKTYGMFTSPHLVSINERFILNKKMVSDEAFTAAFHKVIKAVEQIISKGHFHPTFFELLFAMAMVIFEEKKVEYAILETGLGGRLDATNMIENPVLSIITTIGLDHTEVLGDTIEKIALEKAGIIKQNVPLIFDATNTAVCTVIESVAKQKNSNYYKLVEPSSFYGGKKEEFSYEILRFDDKNIDFLVKYGYDECINVSLDTIATYQVKNSCLAIRAMQLLEGLDDTVIFTAIKKARWSGRMEMIMPEVYLDGAHNENGMEAFIKTVEQFKNDRKVLLFSAVIEKNYKKMIQDISKQGKWDAVVVTQLDNKRAIPLEVLQKEFEKDINCEVFALDNIKEAFELMLQLKTDKGIAFCAGSLYLVGEIIEIVRRIRHD